MGVARCRIMTVIVGTVMPALLYAGEGGGAEGMREALRGKVAEGLKAGRDVRLSVRLLGMRVRAVAKEADARGIKLEAAGTIHEKPWGEISDVLLYSAAGQAVDDRSGEDRMLLAKFAIANKWNDKAEGLLYGVKEMSPFLSAEADRLLAELKGETEKKPEKSVRPLIKRPVVKKETAHRAKPGPAEMDAIIVAGPVRAAAPDWAEAEFALFEGAEEAIGAFLDKFLEPSGAVCVHVDNAGTADDIVEGIAPWDRYLVLSGSDRVREAYRSIWKNVYNELIPVNNGFRGGYYAHGYDAEHASELLQHLWGCLDVFPEDAELIEQNRKVADAIFRCIDKRTGLFTSLSLNNSGGGKGQGSAGKTSGHDYIYMNALFQDYIRSGNPQYRIAMLRFGEAMNRAAENNKGLIPCTVFTNGALPADWWNGPFSYPEWGCPGVGGRGWGAYPSIGAFLTGGDERIFRGLRSSVKVLFEAGGGNVPAHKFDGKSWTQGNNWQLMHVIERIYDNTWDAESAEWVKKFGSGYAKYFYFGAGGTGQPAASFRNRAEWMKQQAERVKNRTGGKPKTGDELTEMAPDFFYGYHYIDGNWWAMGYDNGRCGSVVNTPVRYFGEKGRTGLPAGVAAVVTHVEKDWLRMRLYNRNAESVRMWITGGFYGTHRIAAIRVGDNTKEVGSPRMLVELPAKVEVEFDIVMQRCAYRPNAFPWKYRGVAAEPLPEGKDLRTILNIPF
ncbi:MAG: hypothetical protein JW909_10205 [Planctomycetes bacterium]|nr:hypothetical protein [Planctomycetota bacterium]